MIKRRNGKYELRSMTGRQLLGTHDTKEQALKQEAAINASKQKKNKNK